MSTAFPRPEKRKAGVHFRAFTHTQLVNVARKWLTRKCVVVVTELASRGCEQPDAFGYTAEGATTVIECKASREDFKADAKKIFRYYPEEGMGLHRYYMAPSGMLDEPDLPAGWGLLAWDGRYVKVIRHSTVFNARNEQGETRLLIKLLRRIDLSDCKAVSVRTYQFDQYATTNRATLGTQRGEDA